jgi:hypothetical protein
LIPPTVLYRILGTTEYGDESPMAGGGVRIWRKERKVAIDGVGLCEEVVALYQDCIKAA